MVINLKVRYETTRQERLSIQNFDECIGYLTENQFCDTRYRIDFDPTSFFLNNCLYTTWYLIILMNPELKYTIKYL